MTVSYQYEVASSTSGGFTRLLLMWRGSLYKLIYRELLLFLAFFGSLSALYRHALNDSQKKDFEKLVIYCDTFINLIPLSFVLGFYVSHVADRWWKQYNAIPWPDKIMHLVALYVTGNDEYARMLRRSLMRYLNLSLILVLRSISSAVKRRFPTLDHVVDSGFMTSLELELFQSVPSREFNTYWIPCTWFVNLLKEARHSQRVPDPQGLKLIMEEFSDFRSKCGLLWSYDWVSIPLVYTQVVTLATYSFFAVALVGRQYIEGSEKQLQLKIDIYCPLFTVLQFFFFMGLLKVAEQLINPFGDDDEDFELNWLIDRHTKVSYLGVDTLMNRCPPLVKDIYFDAENLTLPYTEAAAAYKKKTYRGSVADMSVPEEKQTMFLPGIAEEEEEYRNTPTPRTSSANLDTYTDSPVNGRRQISGSPQTSPSMDSNRSETVLQLDTQELSTIETEQRRRLTDAVRKFSAMAKSATPRFEARKPFFPVAKPPKVMLQPWPSATNLTRSARRQAPGTPAPFPRDTSKILHISPSMDIRSSKDVERKEKEEKDKEKKKDYKDDGINRGGFVNSAFFQEDVANVCRRDNENREADRQDEIYQFRCTAEPKIVQHIEVPTDTMDLPSSEQSVRSRIGSCSKYLSERRRRESSGKKEVHWKEKEDDRDRRSLWTRRRTVDVIPPTIEIAMPQSKSFPNLSHLADNAKQSKDDSDKLQEDSRL